jgi:copper chaperone
MRRMRQRHHSTATLHADVPIKIVKITSTLPAQRLIETIEAAGFHPSLRT